FHVTGVQTCALPISGSACNMTSDRSISNLRRGAAPFVVLALAGLLARPAFAQDAEPSTGGLAQPEVVREYTPLTPERLERMVPKIGRATCRERGERA